MAPITIPTPSDFEFAPTVLSHGWCELPPFNYNDETRILERIQKLSDGHVVKLLVGLGEKSQTLRIAVNGLKGGLNKQHATEVRQVVSRCLNLAQDLRHFYKLLRSKPRYRWVTKVGAGRLLISPTVWEDLAKTLLTTNTTWNVTVQMCRRLATLGDHYDGGGNCFPAPQQIASLTLKDLTDQVRAGYRSAYLYELATAIAEGKISVEEWRNTELTTEELYRRISSLKGFGDYASGSMLKLLGRFDRLGIDTSCREVFKVQLNGGKNASDDEIRAYYEPFGDWRGLVMWMDVMKVNLLAKLNPS